MTKSKLTRKEITRMHDLRSLRMVMCDAGRWTRDSYNVCAKQQECEDEIRKLRAKEQNKIWL